MLVSECFGFCESFRANPIQLAKHALHPLVSHEVLLRVGDLYISTENLTRIGLLNIANHLMDL